VRTDYFDYVLPNTSIARYPTAGRDGARLLVLDATGLRDSLMVAWPELVPPSALVVLNDTQVFKARLYGRRLNTGGSVELLLLSAINPARSSGSRQLWRAIGRASKPLRPGTMLDFTNLSARVMERMDHGELLVELHAAQDIDSVIDKIGHVPIPPYLDRIDEACDVDRYQTVYAARRGSVAAPTAGLHISEAMLKALSARGIGIGHITLHIGIGTFRPVTTDDLDQHEMHEEPFAVPAELAAAIARARHQGGPVIAVGTTVVRALESAADPCRPGHVTAGAGTTRLLIQPGYRFKVTDGLLTNFHLPKSTLLALVAAFAGLERTLEAYRVAVQLGYRFLSYGDAMWIPPRR
jgi:S-adenosylmethionine:tRNA ribosyltransferase-isomerase